MSNPDETWPLKDNSNIWTCFWCLERVTDGIGHNPSCSAPGRPAAVEVRHTVWLSAKEIHCADGCRGPEPHIAEYRSLDVQPTPRQAVSRQAAE